MIPIKFRGKRKDNGEWVYGYYTQISHPNCCIEHRIYTGSYWDDEDTVPVFFEVIPETVRRFVCADKNDNDVYAGAPVRYAGKDYPKGFSWDESGLRWTLNDGYYHSHYGATGTGGEDDYFDIELIEEKE